MNNRIAIIIPYFGKFPEWFDMYLYSCSKNEFVDFIFYTDCKIPERIYSNTLFYQESFECYCRRVSACLGVEFAPKYAYKLCDIRPFYGEIHSDILTSYEFWGYADIDLVYGDLSILLSEYVLSRYDIISAHHDRLSGHCTIIRKNSKYHKMCWSLPEWETKVSSDQHYGLDEVDFSRKVYPELRIVASFYRRVLSLFNIDEYKYREVVNSVVRFCTRRFFKEFMTTLLPKDGQVWRYNVADNKVYSYDGRELPYLHFMFFKKTQYAETMQYWREGFWQIPSMLDYENYSGDILIDNRGITV